MKIGIVRKCKNSAPDFLIRTLDTYLAFHFSEPTAEKNGDKHHYCSGECIFSGESGGVSGNMIIFGVVSQSTTKTPESRGCLVTHDSITIF